MKNYVCYDGVDGDKTLHETEEEAIAKLKSLVSEGLEGDEWMDGVDRCFIAKITHTINKVKVERDPIYEDDDSDTDYFDMRIQEKCAL